LSKCWLLAPWLPHLCRVTMAKIFLLQFVLLFIPEVSALMTAASLRVVPLEQHSPRCALVAMGVSRKRRREGAAEASKATTPPVSAIEESPDALGSRALQEPGSADADILLQTSRADALDAAAADPAPAGCEPVFALSSGENLSSARVGSLAAAPTYAAVLAALLSVQAGDEPMVAFVQANRDLLDYRFLYQLTADKLRADNTGRLEEAQRLQAARTRAVYATQRFDAPLFKQVAEAESRLGGLLAQYMQGKVAKPSAVVQAAGTEPQAIFAFWMVILAAVAAWEVIRAACECERELGKCLGARRPTRRTVALRTHRVRAAPH